MVTPPGGDDRVGTIAGVTAPATPTATRRLSVEGYSDAQRRAIDAALELFADHGVAGTSIQMIADSVGVTKAAIYHQFNAKDELVLAVAEVGLAPLEAALDEAEAEPTPEQGREVLLERVVDMAIAHRRWVNALQGDPVMLRLLGTHEPFIDLMNRIYGLLLGVEQGPRAQVRTAIISAAVGATIVHPLVADLDDEVLRTELLAVTRGLFDLPG
jgi:AcrR family transcriptional regulator